jgi:RNA polymerase sigma-70 factor (ECF subfamily)
MRKGMQRVSSQQWSAARVPSGIGRVLDALGGGSARSWEPILGEGVPRHRDVGVEPGEIGEPAEAEAALLRDGRAGDRLALERLLAGHEHPLLALCHGILGHAEDAEDAVQETFLRALRALPSFRGEAAFRTWLFRIAVNVCLSWKSSRRSTVLWDEEQAPTLPHTASPEATALRRLQIREALSHLLPRQRALLLLKEREGWSVAEIAEGLRWSERQVRYELSKARRALVEWRRRESGEGDAE